VDGTSGIDQLSTLALFVLLSSFFAVAEVGLFGANRQRLKALSGEGRLTATIALRLLDHPSRLLSSLAVLSLVSHVATAVLIARAALAAYGANLGAWIAFGAGLVLLLVAGEILPKSFAASWPDTAALWTSIPIHLLSILLSPFSAALSRVAFVAAWPFGARVPLDHPLVTQGDVQLMMRMGEADGTLEEGEREMITSIFEFGETIVREIMVPRIDIAGIPLSARIMDVVDNVMSEGHSRIPVYRDSVDHIVGVVYVKDLFRYLREGRTDVTAGEVMRRAYYVPETKKVADLFKEMRQKKVHLAIVVDEYGGTAGLVTIEDVLEEIVGEIQDEYDVEETEPLVMLDEWTALVDGRMNLKEVNDRLAIALPAGDVDSLGGFVYSRLGHVPAQGEEIVVDDIRIRVEALEGQRIALVRVTKPVVEEARA
jgi:CBS domain containing-hemolysin-like protein